MRFILLCATLLILSVTTASAEVCSRQLNTTPSTATTELRNAAAADCTEVWQGTLPRTGIAARIMFETGLDTPPGFESRVRNGLGAAESALSKLGPSAQVGSSITVMVVGTGIPDALALAQLVQNKCYIVVFPSSWRDPGETAEMEFTMAHEMFHCIQEATFPIGLITAGITRDASGEAYDANVWWSEGSAEWFGYVAQPDHVSEVWYYETNADSTPMNSFSQEDWAFFAWYADAYGYFDMMNFMNEMPQILHTSTTVTQLMSPQEWADYATSYAAFQIPKINGQRIVPNDRFPRPVISVDTDRAYGFPLPVAQLVRQEIVLAEGKWEVTVNSSDPVYYSEINGRNDPDGNWEPFSGTLEFTTPCGEEDRYALAGFGSATASAPFKFTARRLDEEGETSCVCATVPESRDSCLVGLWLNPAIEPEVTIKSTTIITPPQIDTFFEDGTYTHDYPVESISDISDGDTRVHINFPFRRTTGTWGVRNGKLWICEDRLTQTGTRRITGPASDDLLTLDKDEMMEEAIIQSYNYTCAAETLTINVDFRRLFQSHRASGRYIRQ